MNSDLDQPSGVRAFLLRHPILSAAIETVGVVSVVEVLVALKVPFFRTLTGGRPVEELLIAALTFPVAAIVNLAHDAAQRRRSAGSGDSDDRAA